MPPTLTSLWVLLLFSNSCSLLVGALNEEGSALISLKGAIAGDPEGSLADWSSSDEDPCSWNGVGCMQGKVVSISLPKKRLLGTLPSSLGELPSLRHVNLRGNRLHGSLPSELFRAQGLQSLVLYGNSLSGSLPPEIGNASFLQTLDLSRNLFNGSIPFSLLQCRRLRALDLSRNNFTDALPVGFGSSLSALEKLDLSYNRFSGSIPSDIGELSSLQDTMDLSRNLFSGAIPASLGNLPEKVYIDLTYNNLSGRIPQSRALENRGPTAFVGNPGLCGPPLKNPCTFAEEASSPSALPSLPRTAPPAFDQPSNSSSSRGRGLSKSAVLAIVVGDVVGIGLMAVVFFYRYRKVGSSEGKEEDEGGGECFCFGKDESETSSENNEQFDLIPPDGQVRFSLDELLKASAFVLAKSGIGILYRVVLENGLTLAVRRLGEGGPQRFREFQTEVEAIGKVRHPNIVMLRAFYWSVDEKLLVYDYIPNGNLAAAIHGTSGSVNFSPLPWNARLKIMKGVAKGLAFLHEFSPKKYVHGDLKPNNILLGRDMEPFISNFGLGHLINIAGGSSMVALSAGKPGSRLSDGAISPITSSTQCYRAPEAAKTLKPSHRWDVYSYGVILLGLITGRSPIVLSDTSEVDLVRWVQHCTEERKPLLVVLDPYLAQETHREDEIFPVLKIALACVQLNPERRPSMSRIAEILDTLANTNLTSSIPT